VETKWNKLETSVFEICPANTLVGFDYSGLSLKELICHFLCSWVWK